LTGKTGESRCSRTKIKKGNDSKRQSFFLRRRRTEKMKIDFLCVIREFSGFDAVKT
jgi:hypothetical protein